MKKVRVPIFTNEYAVNVFIGTTQELIREGAKYTTYSPKTIKRDFENRRGLAYNLFPDLNPLILVDGDLPAYSALATLAHESSHAIHFIEEHLGIDDRGDEFRGHGIGVIMRVVGKLIKAVSEQSESSANLKAVEEKE